MLCDDQQFLAGAAKRFCGRTPLISKRPGWQSLRRTADYINPGTAVQKRNITRPLAIRLSLSLSLSRPASELAFNKHARQTQCSSSECISHAIEIIVIESLNRKNSLEITSKHNVYNRFSRVLQYACTINP